MSKVLIIAGVVFLIILMGFIYWFVHSNIPDYKPMTTDYTATITWTMNPLTLFVTPKITFSNDLKFVSPVVDKTGSGQIYFYSGTDSYTDYYVQSFDFKNFTTYPLYVSVSGKYLAAQPVLPGKEVSQDVSSIVKFNLKDSLVPDMLLENGSFLTITIRFTPTVRN